MSGERPTIRQLHADPWRLRCPKGHSNIECLTTGKVYCRTCDEKYDERLDAKTGNIITGRTTQ